MPTIQLTQPDKSQITTTLTDILHQTRYTVLYFYPKDDTPGCTIEAKGFMELLPQFKKINVQIIGISKDTHESHCKFQEKYGLAFSLITDTELVLHTDPRFDALEEKSMFGRKYMGTARSTFLLDSEGNVIHKRKKVKPIVHPMEVLDYVSHLS